MSYLMNAKQESNFAGRVCLVAMLLVTGCGLLTDDEARIERASKALEGGDFQAAIIDLKSVVRENPDNLRARLLLGRASLAIGDLPSAEKELQRSLDLGAPINEIRVDLARAKLGTGMNEEALALADPNLATTENERYELLMSRGKAQGQLGQFVDALNSLKAADELGIDPVAPLIETAQIHRLANELGNAEAAVKSALQRSPDSVPAKLVLASTLFQMEKTTESQEVVDSALATESISAEQRAAFLSLLIEINLLRGNADAANETLTQLADLGAEDSPGFRFLKGRVALAIEEFDTALNVFGRLVAENPNNLNAQLLLGATHLAIGQLGQADVYITGFLAAQPDHQEARTLLGRLRLKQGRPDDAADQFARIAGTGQTQATEFAADRAVAVTSYQIAVNEGRDNAVESLEAWVAENPDDAPVRALLAEVQLNAGENELARDNYEELLRQHPDQPVLLNNLAWTYQELGDSRAVDVAYQANELMPNNANVLDTLGWILANSGDPEQAVSHLEEAYELSRQMPVIGYHLAYALANSGQTAPARQIADDLLSAEATQGTVREEIEALRLELD